MDPTSLERLAALKRQLPPSPDQKAAQPQPRGRHPLETTTIPEQLFAELMNASPDGHVPAHMLKRLRSLEQQRAGDGGGHTDGDGGLRSEQEQYSLFEALLGDGAV